MDGSANDVVTIIFIIINIVEYWHRVYGTTTAFRISIQLIAIIVLLAAFVLLILFTTICNPQ